MKPALHPRAEELLVERALRPLDEGEHRELQQLGVEDDDSLDLAAAALAIASTPFEPMPAHLANLIAASAMEELQTTMQPQGSGLLPGQMPTLAGVAPPQARIQQPQYAPPPGMPARQPEPEQRHEIAPVNEIARAAERKDKKRSRFAAVAPWLAAAACLVIAVGTWWWSRQQVDLTTPVLVRVPVPVVQPPPAAPREPTPSEAREKLIASAKDLTKIEWTAATHPAGQGAGGDVVWSAAEQRGYMRFVGLAPNDRTQEQYQLWIFDKERNQAHPVDGGVFDVTSTGEVIVPITAKLPVSDATLFAVTVEKPGGVVVSDRKRIVVTAARKS